jgi:hypothetical protein
LTLSVADVYDGAQEGIMAKKQKVPVSVRAVVQRINRELKKKGKVLRATRGAEARKQFGGFFVVGFRSGAVQDKNIKLEAFARKVGAIETYEYVVSN